MGRFDKRKIEQLKIERIGEKRCNNQGCLMKIIEYKDSHNITIEFQDEYKLKVCLRYDDFLKGNVKNPYYPSVYGVGIIGTKYPTSINGERTKEYVAWHNILIRCYDDKLKEKRYTYKDVVCCDEWLLYENFYEWLHGQENFDKWLNGGKWCIDKDILVKGNKVYSPETCCLVSSEINLLFTKHDNSRGKLPIGVGRSGNKYRADCSNPFTKKKEYIGSYLTIEEAFQAYKIYKEEFIQNVAETEFANKNISRLCYEAMMNYKVEITD